jgi:hypothetical protein
VYWHQGLPICLQFGSNLDPDPNWQSRTIANTTFAPGTQWILFWIGLQISDW